MFMPLRKGKRNGASGQYKEGNADDEFENSMCLTGAPPQPVT